MDEQLMTAAKTLARWCYGRGVDERILTCGDQLLRKAVDEAIGRPAPAHLEHGLWQQTAMLLRQRRDWDRDHQVIPPPDAVCLSCAVAAEQCPTHAGRRCRACGGQLHRIVVDEGYDIRAAIARAPPVAPPSSSTRRNCWAPRCRPSPPEPGATRLPRSSAAVIAQTLAPHVGDQEDRRSRRRSTGSMGVHMSDAAREEAALEEEARQRAEEVRASEEAAAQAAAAATGPSPDAEIAQVHRSGRQHDHTDTAAYQRPRLGRRRGPRR